MDFLQSNFKRGRVPKRHIKLKDSKGFKVGVDASKYPEFNEALKNIVIKNFKEPHDKIKIIKGKYTKKADNKTSDLIKKSINSIKVADVDKLKKFASKSIKDNSKTFKKDSKEAHDRAYDEIEKEFKKIIIEQIKNICEPLILSQSVHDIDSLYTLEIGLSDHLIGDCGQILEFRFREHILWHMHIHLIPVKIGIVWLGVADVHTKGIAHFHDLDNMTHH
jgi:hypothetical protein